jgi:epoxyqueuosine reductase
MLKKKLLLHSCCAPCSVYVARSLVEAGFDVTCFFFNPNIDEPDEYDLRRKEMERLSQEAGIPLVMGNYLVDEWLQAMADLAEEPEGGRRCAACFKMRLEETARVGEEQGFALFATTLTVAPMKNALMINETGEKAAEGLKINYMPSDFKKKDGYRKSAELSRQMGLYRQNYCGCSFSKKNRPGA